MMRLHIVPSNVDCPNQVFALVSNSLCASYSSIKERKGTKYGSPFESRKLFKSLILLDKCYSRVNKLRTVSRASMDEGFSQYHAEGGSAQSWGLSGDEDYAHGYSINTGGCAASETKPSSRKDGVPMFSRNSLWQSQVDLLEPKMLGITPEPPDWPERKSVMWANLEQKAKRFDLPFSLKMIQKRHQREGSLKGMGDLACSSVTKAFSSMVSIIVELQSCALHMREALCDEDLKLIISRVQSDMHLSFAWLFQQVFSRTPALMVHVMILLANFSVYSTSHNFAAAQASLYEAAEGIESLQHSHLDNLLMEKLTSTEEASEADSEIDDLRHLGMSSGGDPKEVLQVGNPMFRNAAEVSLWNSFLDEAKRMQAESDELVLDHDVLRRFVSPISVELEPDKKYMEFLRTDLMYQMGLSQEPDNPLLLSNYAQFLHLVAHDYNRAEECYKRAIQVEPRDAEPLIRYADFLWTVRKDLWRAEDTYLQALSIEPESSYYAFKYASFLWNSGAEETCFPLDTPDINISNSNL
ncbi:OLC1v1026733C1 [Oldenlandia corymbosa var. corymbosa]|uniref:OLC1v1026733C1 n=1 Tax=Oldenlandia corymbosa var. corymbosa TaxID=529605 RepID=A0AAV1CAJ0_OLDCO|nr:OLC1v1026733C1 [Oldenlandia corymbosa var. corymbosa]